MSDLPPLPALRCFEAVARLGSVTRAARELHVTHSAVSQQIRQLEGLLGVTLFVREGRRLWVSEDGRLYALQIREALGELAEATRLVRHQPRSSELQLAVLPSFGQAWLVPRLPSFLERNPCIAVRLHAGLAVRDLSKASLDAAVRMGHGPWEGAEAQWLFQDELVVVASPRYAQGRLPGSDEAILACRRIGSGESWQPWCQMAGLDEALAPAALTCNDSNLVLEAVRLGQGIALERRSLVHDALQRGELVQLSAHTPAYPFPYWLVLPHREAAATRQRAFAEWLLAEVEVYRQACAAG